MLDKLSSNHPSAASRLANNDRLDRSFCVAPMMDWSDSYCRSFWRGITQQALLYTEMVNCGAVIHGDTDRFLQFNALEQPLALQLGGSKVDDLARCAEIAQKYGFAEVNLNAGCPSERVQSGAFGACLMADAPLVKQCMQAMIEACDIPVTIKHRIGIDDLDSYDFLKNFVTTVAESGTTTFIVHARKAILKGLSPKQNRDIPPLIYERVYQLKQDFPSLEIIINGGINDLDSAAEHLKQVDGVMVGRAAYNNPWHMHDVDARFYQRPNPSNTREQALLTFLPYWQALCDQGVPMSRVSRHVLGLFHGQIGGKQFRRTLSEASQHGNTDLSAVNTALNTLKELTL